MTSWRLPIGELREAFLLVFGGPEDAIQVLRLLLAQAKHWAY